jgi:hypothetical protein
MNDAGEQATCGPGPGERDAEVMGQPEPGIAEVMGRTEPAGERTDVMGGPGSPAGVMRGRARHGPGKRPDVMGGPGRRTDVMRPPARQAR